MTHTLLLIAFVYMLMFGMFGNIELTLMFGSTFIVLIIISGMALKNIQKKIYDERKKK